MAFYGYNGDVGDCQWTPYSVIAYEHDLFPPQSSSTSSFYEFEEPKSVNYYNQFDSDTIQSTVHYSVYEQQTPSSYVTESFYPQTNYIINYSTLEFNEPKFEEYDDTPYGGGYDIALTYGKPLPPSDHICYPRSTPQPGLKSEIPDGFSYGSISSPYGEISKAQPNANGIKSADQENREDDSNVKEDVIIEKPIEVEVDRIGVDEDLSFDNGKSLKSEGSEGPQVPKYPYGSGLEAMDICDSIFGYWPCLEKKKQQNLSNVATFDDQNQRDPWKSVADYLFGSGFVYDEEEQRGMSHGHGYYFDGQHFDYSYN